MGSFKDTAPSCIMKQEQCKKKLEKREKDKSYLKQRDQELFSMFIFNFSLWLMMVHCLRLSH